MTLSIVSILFLPEVKKFSKTIITRADWRIFLFCDIFFIPLKLIGQISEIYSISGMSSTLTIREEDSLLGQNSPVGSWSMLVEGEIWRSEAMFDITLNSIDGLRNLVKKGVTIPSSFASTISTHQISVLATSWGFRSLLYIIYWFSRCLLPGMLDAAPNTKRFNYLNIS